jgi:hypothetical protein
MIVALVADVGQQISRQQRQIRRGQPRRHRKAGTPRHKRQRLRDTLFATPRFRRGIGQLKRRRDDILLFVPAARQLIFVGQTEVDDLDRKARKRRHLQKLLAQTDLRLALASH